MTQTLIQDDMQALAFSSALLAESLLTTQPSVVSNVHDPETLEQRVSDFMGLMALIADRMADEEGEEATGYNRLLGYVLTALSYLHSQGYSSAEQAVGALRLLSHFLTRLTGVRKDLFEWAELGQAFYALPEAHTGEVRGMVSACVCALPYLTALVSSPAYSLEQTRAGWLERAGLKPDEA